MSNSKFGLRTRKGIIRPFVEGAQAVLFDADALAYITANTAITSTADKNAINTFYSGLKSDGIYTKIKAMYLPICCLNGVRKEVSWIYFGLKKAFVEVSISIKVI